MKIQRFIHFLKGFLCIINRKILTDFAEKILQEPQMFQQDLKSQKYKDDATGKFGLCFVAGAENIPDLYTDGREDESRDSDKGDCG